MRSLTCHQCNTAFTCTGDTTCWCATLPHTLSPTTIEDCLCPTCLPQKIEQEKTRGGKTPGWSTKNGVDSTN
jgi:hypothetical protein